MARGRRTPAPRAGGGRAAFRSGRGGGGSRRRQAHEQGLAACGVLGKRLPSPKRDSQGSGPLSGCGQSPPFPLREDCADAAASWSAGRHASVFPPRRACRTALEGQTAPQTALPRDKPKSGAPTLKRLCPAGANSVESAHRQRPLAPAGQGSVISLSLNLPFRIGIDMHER